MHRLIEIIRDPPLHPVHKSGHWHRRGRRPVLPQLLQPAVSVRQRRITV
jgi:hypothetical protein